MIIDKAFTSFFLKRSARNKVVIVDAYLYDSLVPFLCRGLISPSLFNRILSFGNFFRGDIEIFTDAHSDKLYKRRFDDYGSIESVKCNRKYFLAAAKKMRSPVIYVDSSIDVTINQVIIAILAQLLGYDKISKDSELLHTFLASQQVKSVAKKYKRNITLSLTKKPKDLLLHFLSDPHVTLDDELLANFQFDHLNFEYFFSKALQCRVVCTILERFSTFSLPL